MSRVFKDPRDRVNPYSTYTEIEQPDMRQNQALAGKWYKRRFAESTTIMAAHTIKAMGNFYELDQDDIEWKVAAPKLSLKTILSVRR